MSEEMWHVQIEPGDVKTVTLEQMDDMYRLELISSSTLVWQPGMAKALPLSVIAGIEEESDVMEIEPELIPEPVYSTRSVAPAPASVTARSVAPAPASVRYPTMPPPPTAIMAPVAAPVVAPVLRAPVAPALASHDFYSPESLRPITMSDIPALRGKSGGGAGKILLGIAIAAGLFATLYRNDLLRPMAASAGQTSAYERLESALGAPGFGTPQQVTQLSSLLNPAVASNALSDTSTSSTPTTTTTPTTPSEETTDSAEDSSTKDSTPSQAAAPAAVAKQPQTSSRRVSAPPRAKSQAATGKPMKSFKGSEYDPMNSKL